MDITAFIRELLFGHDCVIVPGFGGFIGNYTPARIDKATNTFYPPVKQISFNRNLNHNDGLLVGRISGHSGLGYGDTRNLVEQFVEETNSKLAKGERVVFEHIGTFVNNHEGNVQFEPDRDANYHLNSFGLTPFQFLPLEGFETKRKIGVQHAVSEPARRAAIRKYLWRAAVIVPILGALVTVPLVTDIFRTRVESTNLNPLAAVEAEKSKETPSATGISKDSVLQVTIADTTSDTASSGIGITEEYHVIAGSFKSGANADGLMKRLVAEGYSPELIDGPDGFIRVSAAKCSSLGDAIRKRDSLNLKYSGSWITRTRQ